MTELIEKLAELEHEQWLEWSTHLSQVENISNERIKRWERDCWKPYSQLSEEMKEHDRVWARKVLALFEKEKRAKKEVGE